MSMVSGPRATMRPRMMIIRVRLGDSDTPEVVDSAVV
jgi:hypothetical protein